MSTAVDVISDTSAPSSANPSRDPSPMVYGSYRVPSPTRAPVEDLMDVDAKPVRALEPHELPWDDDEVNSLMDYVARHGMQDWDALERDSVLAVRSRDRAACLAKFDEMLEIEDDDLDYHFPYVEIPLIGDVGELQRKDKEAAGKDKADTEAQEDGEEEEAVEDEEEEEEPVKVKSPPKPVGRTSGRLSRGRVTYKDDSDSDDAGGDDSESDAASEVDDYAPSGNEDSDDDDDDEYSDDESGSLMRRGMLDEVRDMIDVDYDDELDYHPEAYYPEDFKTVRRLFSERRRHKEEADRQEALARAEAAAIEAKKTEVYQPRGMRSSARFRGTMRKSYNVDEAFVSLERDLKRDQGSRSPSRSPSPKLRIDKVLAWRETTQHAIDEEKSQQEGSEHHMVEHHLELRQLKASGGKGGSELISQYLIKPADVAYRHCAWITVEEVEEHYGENGIRALGRFDAKRRDIEAENLSIYGGEPFNPELLKVDRVIARTFENGVELFLVKWVTSPYSSCTWETRADVDDEAQIALFEQRNTLPAPLTEEQQRIKVTRPSPARVAQWYADGHTPPFLNDMRLRDYQLDGLNWMVQCFHFGRNNILADEMGLGKTIQSVSYLFYMVTELFIPGPFLIVVPLSTIEHWKREIETWTSMNVVMYYDSEKGSFGREIIRQNELYYPGTNRIKFNVLLTTYETLLADLDDLSSISFEQVIIDEGHRLKNAEAKLFKALNSMRLKRKMLLTGTPIQNNTEELWTLLNFIEPQEFYSSEEFLAQYGNLKTHEQVEGLQKVIRPYVLRRMKESVETSIPDKEETIIDIELTTMQKQYYRAIYDRNREFLSKGSENMPSLMNIEMELRKCCNHPWLIDGAEDRELDAFVQGDEYVDLTVKASGKLVLLDKLLPKLQSEGHRVLIFSQMKVMLDILEGYIEHRNYKYERLDGSTNGNHRQQAIDRFSAPNSDRFLFLLSTRAGGVGLNLTAADTVIIFDSDWNPQQDVQAQARVHRIGQKKSVMIYRLVTRNTYEASMFERASMKLGLDQAVLGNIQSEKGMNAGDKEQLDRLLKLGAYGAFLDDDTAADKFVESNIDDILAHGSRVIKHSADAAAAGGAGAGLGSVSYSKMVFSSDGSDSNIDINDPDFWNKLLSAKDSQTMISMKRLEADWLDALTTSSNKIRTAFFDLMKEKVRQTLVAKNAGQTLYDLDPLLDMLRKMETASKFYNRKKFIKAWIKDLQRRTRRGGNAGDSASDNDDESDEELVDLEPGSAEEFEDASDFNEDSDDPAPRSKRSKAKGKSKKAAVKKATDVIQVGISFAGQRLPKGDLCGTCKKRGGLISCDGMCNLAYHPTCVGLDEGEVPDADKEWFCPSCSTERYACSTCRVEGPYSETADPADESDLPVLQCQQAGCSVFLHMECAEGSSLTNFYKDHNRFRCARHYCVLCEKSGGPSVVSCVFCTSTFHFKCFLPSQSCVRLTRSDIVCPGCLPRHTSDPVVHGALEGVLESPDTTDLLRERLAPQQGSTRRAVIESKSSSSKTTRTGSLSVRVVFDGEEVATYKDVPVGIEEPDITSPKRKKRRR